MKKSPRSITVRAPAKINLHLGVGAPREDGMHPLLTVYQAIGLYDDLTVRDAANWRLAVTVADYVAIDSVPQHGHNIVDRAADLLAAHHGIERCGDVLIDKSIPVAGGMAGGSADAAAALVVLDRLWGVNTSDEDLLAIAAELGSDVPFALVGGTALGTGRGELVDPVPDENTWWWVLRLTPVGLSTPEVYRHFDRLFPDAPPTPPPADTLLAALAAHDPQALAASLHNDLQAPAFDLRPDLEKQISFGEAEGALRGLVSGSGPTCVYLCESGDHARAVAGALVASAGDAAPPVVLVANGPVAGAHVVEYTQLEDHR
jgi:4-diphosphocytidyl-2-C-methyl-D-erythritol kinase